MRVHMTDFCIHAYGWGAVAWQELKHNRLIDRQRIRKIRKKTTHAYVRAPGRDDYIHPIPCIGQLDRKIALGADEYAREGGPAIANRDAARQIERELKSSRRTRSSA